MRASSSYDNKVWPIDVFQQVFTDSIVNMIVEETNRYAEQIIGSNIVTRKSRLKAWSPTNADEIKKFFGLVIYMGPVPLPEINLYWSKSCLYSNVFVEQTMTRDRFFLLLRMVHFCNNADADNDRRDFKVRKLIKALIENFQAHVVIDESMVPFRGRLGFRQYIPGKSHKYGCKLFKLCTTDGYTLNLELYTGQSTVCPPLGCTESLVMRLIGVYLNKGRTLFADYYTTNLYAEHLLARETYYCGTLTSNRKNIPKNILKENLKKGKLKGLESNAGVKVFNWKDKRTVLTLSTIPEHETKLVASGKSSRSGEQIKKP